MIRELARYAVGGMAAIGLILATVVGMLAGWGVFTSGLSDRLRQEHGEWYLLADGTLAIIVGIAAYLATGLVPGLVAMIFYVEDHLHAMRVDTQRRQREASLARSEMIGLLKDIARKS
ncbi:MAG: hypothetical protein KF684_04180 [Phycisphaeraceae bacterium]|nr:hypothetical protein [Phycisphaeraceae bacterium]